jgi:hypothetical protein
MWNLSRNKQITTLLFMRTVDLRRVYHVNACVEGERERANKRHPDPCFLRAGTARSCEPDVRKSYQRRWRCPWSGAVKVSRLCELKVSAPGVVKKGRIDKETRWLRPEKMRRERREAIVQGSRDSRWEGTGTKTSMQRDNGRIRTKIN